MSKNFSHHLTNYSEHQLNEKVSAVKDRLMRENIISGYSYDQLIKMVDELAGFDLGKFLLINHGIDGYWTDYIINLPREKVSALPSLEQVIFNSRIISATYQRQQIFKQENQKKVRNNNHLAAIPSGLMSELLDLDYNNINNIQITAIDLDPQSFVYSQQKYPELYQKLTIHQQCQDALKLNINNEFDLISSNGLTIYIPEDAFVHKIFENFYLALKPGGKLVTSFLTYPVSITDKTEQRPITDDNKQKLELALFVDILQVKWSCFRTTTQFVGLLNKAGFAEIEIIADDNYIFPTAITYKP